MNKNNQRPTLDKNISPTDFLDFYWLKEELQNFCREIGAKVSGPKTDLTQRITCFLETGTTPNPNTPTTTPKTTPRNSPRSSTEMTLETTIEPGFKCTQEHRKFFKSVIGPTFHFSVELQNFLKQNPGKTFADVVEKHYQILENKKNGTRTTISPQFEYNTFLRAFYDDPKNKNLPLQDAITAWKKVRNERGDNAYQP